MLKMIPGPARAAGLALMVQLLFFPVPSALAAGTGPALAVATASAAATGSGGRVLRVAGTINFDDLLQFSFPAGLVVHQGADYAIFQATGEVLEGSSPSAADGINASEVSALLQAGSPAGSEAALGRIDGNGVVVALPARFSTGVATVFFYAFLDNTMFISNAVNVSLP